MESKEKKEGSEEDEEISLDFSWAKNIFGKKKKMEEKEKPKEHAHKEIHHEKGEEVEEIKKDEEKKEDEQIMEKEAREPEKKEEHVKHIHKEIHPEKIEEGKKEEEDEEIDLSGLFSVFGKKKPHGEEKKEGVKEKELDEHEKKEEVSELKKAEEKHEHKRIDTKEGHGQIERKEEDEEIDLSGLFSIFGKKKASEEGKRRDEKKEKEHYKHKKEEGREEKLEDEDEVSLDFSFLKNIFKKEEEKVKKEGEEEEISIDFAKIFSFFNKHKYLLIILLILIPVYLSINVRMQTATLPFTDGWASSSVYNFYKQQISNQVNQQNPNLPQQVRTNLIDQQYQKFLKDNKNQIDAQIKGTSLYFKTAFENEKPGDCLQDFSFIRCQSYMPDIDPYYWYRYANNILEHGYTGDEKRDDVDWDNHMLAPNGRGIAPWDKSHPYFLVWFYHIMTIFNSGLSLMQSMFFYPVVISALSVLLIFLITRRIIGNMGALFAASMMALNFSFLNRTLFGHADSDAWVVFFPVLATWLFLEAFESKNKILQIVLSILSAFTLAIFSRFWAGWWYIFDFLLGAAGIYLIYLIIMHRNEIKMDIRKFIYNSDLVGTLIVLFIFFISAAALVSLLSGFGQFETAFFGITRFTEIKNPVIANLWPNVLTTVAELNEGSLSQIISSMGGKFLFYISMLGIALSMTRRNRWKVTDYIFVLGAAFWYFILLYFLNLDLVVFFGGLVLPIFFRIYLDILEKDTKTDLKAALLLIIWFIGTMYASIKGIRFTLLLVPAFSIAFGITFGFIYEILSKWLGRVLEFGKTLTQGVSILIICFAYVFLFIPPIAFWPSGGIVAGPAYAVARQDVPIINDAWYDSLTLIKDNSKPDAIITSWWDFGHHFKALADRPVTFDGTTQEHPQSHWVGKILLTDDEKQAFGILRMLDCGGNNAFDVLFKINNDTHKSVDILYDIIVRDKEDAKDTLINNYALSEEKAEEVLKYTHCEPPEGFFIASEDMIGKAGVWAHFGSWNFERAEIWQVFRNMPKDEAVNEMIKKFNYTQKQAEDLYYQAKSITDLGEANRWIAPWPGYLGTAPCQNMNESFISCDFGLGQNQVARLIIDIKNYNVSLSTPQGEIKPSKFVYINGTNVEEKIYENAAFPYGVVLIPAEGNYNILVTSPELASGMFTRMFYLKGQGLKYFRPFSRKTSLTGTDIYVYKVDWQSNMTPNIVDEFMPKTTATVNYIGWLENGTIFDSSIKDWGLLNITPETDFTENLSYNPFTFVLGNNKVIPGFEEAVKNMSINETRSVEIPPEKAYGTDPEKSPLGNKTLFFKIKLENIETK